MRTAFVIALMAAAACSGPKRSHDPRIQDEEITRDIMSALLDDDRFADVRVRCVQGVAHLDGIVTDASDRALAERIAWSVSGVQDVRTRLRLRSR